jgi:putative transposase
VGIASRGVLRYGTVTTPTPRRKSPVTIDTLKQIFRASFDPDFLTKLGRETGAFQRICDITPYNLLLALLIDAVRNPRRSIAGARREHERLAAPVDPKTFDARLDSAGTVRWIWRLVAHLRTTSNRTLRRRWPPVLAALADLLVQDSSTCRVANDAPYSSTTPLQAALKVLTTLSLGTGTILDERLAGARHHDRPLLREQIVNGALYLRDLGFYDHQEFARIEDAEALFVSRLKLSAVPRVHAIFEGLPPDSKGARMTDALPYGPVVDVDAWFTVDGAHRLFRVVMVQLPAKDNKGRRIPGQTMQGWFVTNLPREVWDPVMVSLAYRLRWAVERLFRRGKQNCGLASLRSGRPTILAVFVGVSLLALLLGAWLAAELRAAAGRTMISDDVPLLVLRTWLGDVARILQHPGDDDHPLWIRFRNALVYDARHRRKTQPLVHDAICEQIERRTQLREVRKAA